MQVTLIHFTGKGTGDPWYAARLLAFTKNTRLNMTPSAFDDFMLKQPKELADELSYMSSTIASSWEFVDLVFVINFVSRACAQQMTRTRTASFAMQSQRVTDVRTSTFHIPDSVPSDKVNNMKHAFLNAQASYISLIEGGVSLEDARGVLPMNTHCNLVAKYNLRAWVDLVRSRSSLRVQDEYRQVIEQMKTEVLFAWPWVATFLEPKMAKAIALIEEVAEKLVPQQKAKLAKAADLLKKETA